MEDTLTDEQLYRWWALSLLDDWGGEWRRTAAICSEVHNASLRIMRAIYNVAQDKVAKITTKDFTKPEDFEPKFRWETKKQEAKPVEPVGSVAKLKSLYRL